MNGNYDRYAKYMRDNHRCVCGTLEDHVAPVEMWDRSSTITNRLAIELHYGFEELSTEFLMNLKTFCFEKLKEEKKDDRPFPSLDAIMYPAIAEYCRRILSERAYTGYYADKRRKHYEALEVKKKTAAKANGKAA